MPWAVVRYDVFIFYGHDSFLRYRDLPILKALGKRVIYIFQGSDHRPPYLNGRSVRQIDDRGPGWLARETLRTKKRIERVERHADAIVAHSASAQLHARPFLQYLAIGIPFAGQLDPVQSRPGNHRPIRILHSPTDPVSKGSDHIRAAVERIQSSGHEVEFVELRGRPHAEVIAEVERASFVVDEMFSDTPMAGFGVEAAWHGKAVAVSGLFADQVSDDLPAELIPPTAFVLPDQLDATIERLVVDDEYRQDLGGRARAYVSTRWAPADVAKRFLTVIAGRAPAEWWYEPARLRYFGGWGMPTAMVRKGVRTILAEGGVSALRLDHHPDLLRKVLEFAE